MYDWSRKSNNGYEVSSQGDKRFSALYARLKDGRTIEEAYQLDVKNFRGLGDTPYTLGGEMNYKYNGSQRPGLISETTIEAIARGERTATTRYQSQGKLDYWQKATVGDIIKFIGGSGEHVFVRVTKALHKLPSDHSAHEWSHKEGWSIAYYNNNVLPKLDEAWQLEYEYIGTDNWVVAKGVPSCTPIKFFEDSSSGYKSRTMRNASADVTIAIAMNFKSSGEICTHNCVKEQGKLLVSVDLNNRVITKERIDGIVNKLNTIEKDEITMNIAGNGMFTMKGAISQQEVDDFTLELLSKVIAHPKFKKKVLTLQSGGQTGADEAGAKAGVALGIPTFIIAPKTWKYRGADGVDIADEKLFKLRYSKSEPQLYYEYKKLWRQWLIENPELFKELATKAQGKVLTDKFASTSVSQARALAELLSENESSPASFIPLSKPTKIDIFNVQGLEYFEGVFTEKELRRMEKEVLFIQDLGRGGKLHNNSVTFNQTSKRTQVNFGYYYSYGFSKEISILKEYAGPLVDIDRSEAKGVQPAVLEKNLASIALSVPVEPIPIWINNITDKLVALGIISKSERYDSALINIYPPGGGIPPHLDHNRSFCENIATIRLFSPTIMSFGYLNSSADLSSAVPQKGVVSARVPLTVGSVALLKGDSFHRITHGIFPDDTPEFTVSITLRKISPGYQKNPHPSYESLKNRKSEKTLQLDLFQ